MHTSLYTLQTTPNEVTLSAQPRCADSNHLSVGGATPVALQAGGPTGRGPYASGFFNAGGRLEVYLRTIWIFSPRLTSTVPGDGE